MDRPHFKFWPRRRPRSITVPATSLWHNLATSAARYPDKDALVFFGQAVSYRDFVDQAERLAGTLHALGVRRGDRVVLAMQNCPQLVIAHYAIMRANASKRWGPASESNPIRREHSRYKSDGPGPVHGHSTRVRAPVAVESR